MIREVEQLGELRYLELIGDNWDILGYEDIRTVYFFVEKRVSNQHR